MKGIVFNLLEEVVIEHHGEAVWDALLDAAGLEGVYTSLGNYLDSDMEKLVAAASQALGISQMEVQRWFGREAMPFLVKRYPAFFSAHRSTQAFVLSVNSIIHPEVLKLYPGADVPTFDFKTAEDGALLMGYHSPRRLCALAQGFVEGAAVYFGETSDVKHLSCMHQGDTQCLLRLTFGAAAPH